MGWLKWNSHIVRMDSADPVKRLLWYYSYGKRKVVRSKLSWQDGVQSCGKRWKMTMMVRNHWQGLLQQVRPWPGL